MIINRDNYKKVGIHYFHGRGQNSIRKVYPFLPTFRTKWYTKFERKGGDVG